MKLFELNCKNNKLIKIFISNYYCDKDKIDVIIYNDENEISIMSFLGKYHVDKKGNTIINFVKYFNYKLNENLICKELNIFEIPLDTNTSILKKNNDHFGIRNIGKNINEFNGIFKINNIFKCEIFTDEKYPYFSGISLLDNIEERLNCEEFNNQQLSPYILPIKYFINLINISLSSLLYYPYKSTFILDTERGIDVKNVSFMDGNSKKHIDHIDSIMYRYKLFIDGVLKKLVRNNERITIMLTHDLTEVCIQITIKYSNGFVETFEAKRFFLFDFSHYSLVNYISQNKMNIDGDCFEKTFIKCDLFNDITSSTDFYSKIPDYDFIMYADFYNHIKNEYNNLDNSDKPKYFEEIMFDGMTILKHNNIFERKILL